MGLVSPVLRAAVRRADATLACIAKEFIHLKNHVENVYSIMKKMEGRSEGKTETC